ncbi:TIGR03749 family integrating conjugative element protein [Salmonella enterica]|uniref:TIGR03749 family integrating conjugative element protein n=1 Tax=Salmonella abony TaxID=29482 RepID=A0A5V0FCK0_SALAB|nr:TIGR03749 family integrating conjugative element protein [Salmonella enterica]EBS6067789.1 TIGR03749 family integrating conjugative element protein [Salmonella enterica subsp. enterica serovar Abony]EBH5154318.1 TIGR03749 family integrating conjugative element protein [Salmonella enterica]EBO5191270.1 TIGR03749 family integrating conjugative element protein [Salmonella enterica]EBR2462234.1 TIGR03749 family integrating conjugative element protein [Salmonella enterica]
MMKARVLALSLSVLPLTATFTVPVTQAEELMKWERIPLQIPLAVGKERVLFADKNVRVGFPPALNGKLRVQSSGGAVYLKADAAFPPTRLQLQDVENGEVILLDVTASDKGSAEPVRIVYSGDVTSVSSSNDTPAASGGNNVAPGADNGTQTKRKKVKYNAPLPVILTRYAAQSLYGPVRTVEAVPGIHPVNPHLPKRITTLYPSEPVAITPLGGWGIGSRNVVALKVQNTASRKITLDPRVLQGQFVTATFQHRYLGPVGTPEDTTTLYLVTAGRSDGAFVAEPSAVRKAVKAAKKGANNG